MTISLLVTNENKETFKTFVVEVKTSLFRFSFERKSRFLSASKSMNWIDYYWLSPLNSNNGHIHHISMVTSYYLLLILKTLIYRVALSRYSNVAGPPNKLQSRVNSDAAQILLCCFPLPIDILLRITQQTSRTLTLVLFSSDRDRTKK